MKTLLAVVAVCVLALTTSLVVVGQEQRPLPPGVLSANWIPLGDKAGFVVTPGTPNQEAGVLSGYFLAWHEDSWKRIDSGGGVRFQPVRK